MFDWSNRMIGRDDAEYQGAQSVAEENAALAATELFGYAAELYEHQARPSRRGPHERPDPGRAGRGAAVGARARHLLHAAGGGGQRDHPQPDVGSRWWPSRNSPTSGSGCRNDRSLLPSAVEEMLRFVTPVMNFRRQTTEDVEIGGQADQGRREDRLLPRLGQPGRDGVRGPRPVRYRPGNPTPIWHSAGVGPTSASGPIWPAWRSSSCSSTCSTVLPDIHVNGERRAAAVELHQRGEAPARVVLTHATDGGPLSAPFLSRPSSRRSSGTSAATRSSTWPAGCSASGARPRSPWTRSPPKPAWPGRRCTCTSPIATSCCGRACSACTPCCSTPWSPSWERDGAPVDRLRTLVLGHARAHRRQPRLLPS